MRSRLRGKKMLCYKNMFSIVLLYKIMTQFLTKDNEPIEIISRWECIYGNPLIFPSNKLTPSHALVHQIYFLMLM